MNLSPVQELNLNENTVPSDYDACGLSR